MEKWSFKVRNSPKGISEKLYSSFGELKNVVLDVNHEEKSGEFKVRRRMFFMYGISDTTNIIINGKTLKTPTDNETNIEISFTQSLIGKLLVYGHIVLGLGFIIGLILKSDINSYIFTAGGIVLTIAAVLGLHKMAQDNFNKHVKEYKTLFSRILEV